MTDSEILDLIREALFEVAPNKEFPDLAMSTTIEQLALDSITTMEMVGFLEDRVDTTFPDEELAKVHALGHLASLVRGESLGL